jgi:alpha-L-fucosidase
MYQKSDPAFEAHIKKYGPQDKIGYKDLIPQFKAEKWDPTEWARLFKQAGARYVVPVAEHHDGYAMYDSALSDWTAIKMGPKRDIIADLSRAVRADGMHFGTSFHRAEHNWFFDGGRTFRSDVNDPKYASLYGPAHTWLLDSKQMLLNDWTYVSPEFANDWLARASELVEKYNPDLVYFDWWIGQPSFRPNVTRFAAYYYNYAAEHKIPAVINIKDYALDWNAGARDFERGMKEDIEPRHFDQQLVLGIPQRRPVQDARVHRASVDRHRQQERQPALEHRPARRRHHPRRSPQHAARNRRLAEPKRRSHLRHHAVDRVWRRPNQSPGRLRKR